MQNCVFSSFLLNNLNHIFVHELMILADSLGIVLGRKAPNLGAGELLDQRFMQLSAKLQNRGLTARQNYGRVIIGNLTFGLGVNSE